MNSDPRFPSFERRDAAEFGRFWDALVAEDAPAPDVVPDLAEVANFVRRLHAEPREPAPDGIHDAIRALIEDAPAWRHAAMAPVTADPALISRNGHIPQTEEIPEPTPEIQPRPLRRLLPVVKLVGIAAVLTLLYFAFGREHTADKPTPTIVAPTAVVTPTTVPVTPTPNPDTVGDWPMLGGGPSRSAGTDRFIPDQAPNLRWRVTLAPNIRFPVVAGDAVYVTDGATLFALDAATGAERWRYDLGVAPSVAGANPPAVVAGAVYLASVDGTVFAVDATTGQERWRNPTGERITTAVAVAHDTVFVGTGAGNLYAFDAATGGQRWGTPTGPVTESSPVVTDDLVVVAGRPNQLLALEASSGAVRWQKTVFTDMVSVAVGEGIAVVGSRGTGENYLSALDSEQGTLMWTTKYAPDLPPAIVGRTIYSVGGSELLAFDAASGIRRWHFDATLGIVQASVAGDALLLCRTDGVVIALDATTGIEQWRIATAGTATGTATGAGVLYVAARNGTLAAYSEASMAEKG